MKKPLYSRRRWPSSLLFPVVMVMLIPPTVSLARPPAAKLLAPETVIVLSIPDAPELAERFGNTSIGRMSRDEQLRPLLGQIYGSFSEALSEAQDRLGLTIEQLLAIPQGELTLAVVAPEEEPPAVVILLDAGDQLSNARKLLQRVEDELDRAGAVRSEETVGNVKLIVYERTGPQRGKIIFFEKDATIVVGSSLEVLKQMLGVWNGGDGPTLADNPGYAAIVKRGRGPNDESPNVLLYVDPIGMMRGIAQQNTGLRVAVALLPALGLDGLSAVGGSVTFDAEGFDSILHGHVLLESPRSGVVKMIALRPCDVTPERWVPSDAASYTTFNWDVETTYSTLSLLYDSFRGDGALAKALEARILGPTGIDFEKEIIDSLDGRVTLVTRIQRPVTAQSQTALLGLKLEDTQTVHKALEKIVKLGEGAWVEQTHAGKKYYQLQVPQADDVAAGGQRGEPCLGIVDDYLLVADHASLYRQVLVTAAGPKSLADELDFKLIASKIRRQAAGQKPAMISFNRPEEVMRMLYTLATSQSTMDRLQRRAENEPFFRSLNAALKEHPLPPFAVLRQYLAPTGAMVIDDDTGIHYTAFSLRRK